MIYHVKKKADRTKRIGNVRPTVLFIYKTLAPYHIPRLCHLSECFGPEVNIRCVVIANTQNDYAWTTTDNSDRGHAVNLAITTLFENEHLESISNMRQAKALIRELKRLSPKIVFVAGYSSVSINIASVWAKLNGISTVVISDSTSADKDRFQILELIKRVLLKCFDGALVAGARSREYIERLGMERSCIEVCCDVVDNASISKTVDQSRGVSQNQLGYFLFVGRLIEEKNIPFLIDAYSRYRSCRVTTPPLPLVICGSGPLEKAIKRKVADENIDGVSFEGYINHPHICDYYAGARALVLPSKQETWGLVVNEALSAGVPVLASTSCGCFPDLIVEGKTGWGFETENPSDLAYLMEKIHIMDADRLHEISNSCSKHVDNWGLPRFTEGVMTLCRNFAGIGAKTPTVYK